jgi:phytoene synthase
VIAWCAARYAGSGVETLFALDRQLGEIVRTTAQPIIGQMRLTWWYEALAKLDSEPAPAQPLLADVARQVIPAGVTGRSLATMSEGWEVLLDDERRDPASLLQFARWRGGTLFRALGTLLEQEDAALEEAGAVWALADLAVNVSHPELSESAREAALTLAEQVFAGRWSRARVLGALAIDAQAAMRARGVADGPRRAAMVARFRMIGR